MKETRILMGMPITLEILDKKVRPDDFEKIYNYFKTVDEKFSTYKDQSEISRINRGEIKSADFSIDMRQVLELSGKTKKETNGYFDIITPDGKFDPSGLVKGWAIRNAANLLRESGFKNFYIDAGGDIQPSGRNADGEAWRVGIKNPFHEREIIKVLYVSDQGVATSGNYIRGAHIYDPVGGREPDELVSLTVIGPDVYEADRFATAAFAMGLRGLEFIEAMKGFEAYAVDKKAMGYATAGFEKYT